MKSTKIGNCSFNIVSPLVQLVQLEYQKFGLISPLVQHSRECGLWTNPQTNFWRTIV